MRIKPWFVVAVALLLASWSFSPAVLADPPTYPVRFARPLVVGQSWYLDKTAAQSVHWVIRDLDGHPIARGDRMYGCKLVGRSTALAVNAPVGPSLVQRNNLTRESIVVESLVGYDGANDHQLLPTGSTVVAEAHGWTTRYTMDGHPVSPAVQRALALLVTLDEDPASGGYADRAFGSTAPRSLGQSWPMDAGVYADRRRRQGFPVDSALVHGTITLVAAEQIDAKPWIRLQGKIRIDSHPLRREAASTTAATAVASAPASGGAGAGDEGAAASQPVGPQPTEVMSSSNVQTEWELPIDPDIDAQNSSITLETRYSGKIPQRRQLCDFERITRTIWTSQVRP